MIKTNIQDMSEGCQEAVQALAKCHGRERVDHIVAIHVNAFTGSAFFFSFENI